MFDIDKADIGKVIAAIVCAVGFNLVMSLLIENETMLRVLTLVTPTIIVLLFLQIRTLVVKKLPAGADLSEYNIFNNGTLPCTWEENGVDKILAMNDTSILREDCTDVIAVMGKGSAKWYLIPSLEYYMDNMNKVKRKLPPDVYATLQTKVNVHKMGLE